MGRILIPRLHLNCHFKTQMYQTGQKKVHLGVLASLPDSLSSEDQWVLLKSHGAVSGGRSFGQNQTNKQFQNQLLVHSVLSAEELLQILQQTGQEKLEKHTSTLKQTQVDLKDGFTTQCGFY